jgi:hypothetical protein
LIVAGVVVALLVGKRRPSDRVDGDDSDVDDGVVETMTTFKVNEDYVSQEGFSGAVDGGARNIPDES